MFVNFKEYFMKPPYLFPLMGLLCTLFMMTNQIPSVHAQESPPPVFEFVGYHLVSSYQGCDQEKLRDFAALKAAMASAVEASGATLLGFIDYVFPPDGYTLVMLLSESHASIHTYPEHNACFVDFFTCGRSCSSANFDLKLQEYLNPQCTVSKLLYRDGSQVIIQP